MDENKKRILRIDLVGENEGLFENLRSKLIKTVNKVLDASMDVNSNQTVKR